MTNTIYLIRGLPGAGKSTISKRLAPVVCEADQYFMVEGEYRFDVNGLAAAHADCQARTAAAIAHGDVAVANTFTQAWEMAPYFKIACEADARIVVVDVYDGDCDNATLAKRNAHGVPEEAIARMRDRYESISVKDLSYF
jgi:adenylylsulfate kinase-like enzyme